MHRLLAALFLAVAALPAQPASTISLKSPAGVATTQFQLHDSVVIEANGLAPRAGYDIDIVSNDGKIVVHNRLSTDREGRLPASIVWHGIGVRPCRERRPSEAEPSYSELVDLAQAGRAYTLKVSRRGREVRSANFRVAEAPSKPVLFAANAAGCPKTGFLIGEQDVWAVGRNFPPNSFLRLWAVLRPGAWRDGEPLADVTGQHGEALPPMIELGRGETGFKKLLWPKGQTSIGSYEIAAEVVTYAFGAYRPTATAPVRTLVSSRTHSGFVIQRRQNVAEPLEMDIAGAVQSPFTFRSTFFSNEDVYVGVDPAVQPSFVGKTADVYIVADKTDAQWTNDKSLNDVTGFVEKITVNGICGNCWKTLAWPAPLTPGKYDVVLDFDQDGKYTPGVDLIDSLDAQGFTVANVRVDSISFNYPGAGAIPIYDHIKAADIAAPEFVSAGNAIQAAAWVMGGTHTVRAKFSAAPGVTQAKIWALSGLGGLASAAAPVTVTFTAGKGEATFSVGSPPTAVAKTKFHWDWKYQTGSTVLDIGRTGDHLLYTTLAAPTAPQAKPWLAALDVAASVAEGHTGAAGATRAIWAQFYNNVGGAYDTAWGSGHYTGNTTQAFNLTNWLANYKTASIGTVNCYDMGKAVVVFANALGAGAEYTYTSPFGYLNLVKPIGKGWTNNPFYDNSYYDPNPIVNGSWSSAQGRSQFGNHGFTRVAGKIYDGSGGQVDTDTLPDTSPAGVPRLLDGHDDWLSNYKGRVIDAAPVSTPGAPTVYSFTVY